MVLELRSAEDVARAIERLSIRGAPLIGVAAAYGVAAELRRSGPQALDAACDRLSAARPTAVNLRWAVEQVRAAACGSPDRVAAAEACAAELEGRERAASAAIAAHGADRLAGCGRILTHCNTGALAAPGNGTALAVIVELHRRGILRGVIATESRPLLQGARLTVYELTRHGIAHELIVDSAAAGLLAAGAADAVIVGCDRVAANGDTANKVGTLGLALAARHAGVGFYVAGPTSTIDPDTPDGDSIVIEERAAKEVLSAGGSALAPPATPVRNPAFDVTPAELIDGFITEVGVLASAELLSPRT